jgi:predicted ATP-grasp superfamily ATP-dependent carboligase
MLRYPLVLKPSRSVRTLNGRNVKLDVSHAADPEQLAERERELDEAAFPLLLQERIVGPGMAIMLLTWEGRTLAVFSHQRIREKPPAGGESVYTVSVAADPTLVAKCEALLRHFEWRGALMVEFKIDARTGVPYLMEINARFWAALQLAIDCGVDFPALLLEAALGNSPQPVRDWPVGVRLRWWWGDVDNLITRLIRPARRLALPPGTPGRLGALRDFVATTLRGERDSVLRPQDPGPFVRETIAWLRRQ